MIFSEQDPNFTFDDDPALGATLELEPMILRLESGDRDGCTIEDDSSLTAIPNEDGTEREICKRFIQFSFEEKWFCVDMPRPTLEPSEAEQILRDRTGYFYLRTRPEFTLYGENVDGLDPFRKIYPYGDEQIAAEDMAFVFFHVWKFPLDWRFFVQSSAFGHEKGLDWETGTPLG